MVVAEEEPAGYEDVKEDSMMGQGRMKTRDCLRESRDRKILDWPVVPLQLCECN